MRSIALATFLLALPVIEIPAHRAQTPLFAILVSGDGGWARIDKTISENLAAHGIPVAGLNALQYFWTKRAPETFAHDIGTLIETYGARWNARDVILVGYSRGADVLPFAVSRLPEPLRRRVALVVLLSPSRTTSFEFKVSDWFMDRNGIATKPEIDKLRGTKTLCVYGTDDRESVCPDVDPRIARRVALSGSHHFDRDYDALARIITSEMRVP